MALWLKLIAVWLALAAIVILFFKGCADASEELDENERPVKR